MKPYFIFFLSCTIATVSSCKKRNPGEDPGVEKKVVVTTVAGEGTPAFADGSLFTAKFRYPQDIAVSKNGTLFVADGLNYGVRKVAVGQVSTIADTYIIPYSITVDGNENVYLTDVYDARVRKLAAGTYSTTNFGTAEHGFKDGSADKAQFGDQSSIVADVTGNIYVADQGNNRIRKISQSGIVTTVAGTGEAGFNDGDALTARFDSLGGIAIDKSGNLFIVDRRNFRVRKLTPAGKVSTVAGTGEPGSNDGKASEARFGPVMNDIVLDEKGNLFITDGHRIRKISAQGEVSTIAGSTAGYADGDGVTAKFNYPIGLGIDALGNLYLADQLNHRIRKISFE